MQSPLSPQLAKCKSAGSGWPVLALLGLWLVGLVGTASAGTYTQTVTFSERDLSFSKAGAYDLVSLAGAGLMDQPGRPRLPIVAVRIALPAGAEGVSLTLGSCDSTVLSGVYSIFPAQAPQPVSSSSRAEATAPDAAVYLSENPFPRRAVELAGQGAIAGSQICDVLVYPLRYSPREGKLTLYTRLSFVLDFGVASPEAGQTREHPSADALGLVARLVANPAETPKTSSRLVGDRVQSGGSEIDYLIITSNALMNAFEPLRQWKMRKGLPSEIVSLEGIASGYQGRDLQEKVRNCIKYFHGERGTQWVLLGGDAEIVPVRKAYVPLSDKPDIPCDLYYADLDGSWNADGDFYWGEVPSDSVDMYSDVFLGRAPVATVDEADTFVRKVLTYEGCYHLPQDYQLKMVFLGEVLWGDPAHPADPDYTDGGVAKNLVGSLYVLPRFELSKLYQTLGNLNRASVARALDQGPAVVNVACHGFYSTISAAGDFVSDTDLLVLNSGDRYGLMYSTTCLSGGFDQPDCVGEAWVLAKQGGGFYIGNSRYGWDTPGFPGEGPSDLFDQAFFKSVFVTGFTNLGKAHADAKHEYVGEARGDPYMRYVMYGLNLLGDPELPLWTDVPRSLTVFCPAKIDTGGQVFGVTVKLGGAALSGARVCLWKEGEVYEVGETDAAGIVSLDADAATAGTIHVTVTAQNVLPFMGETAVIASPRPVAPDTLSAVEGSGPCVYLTWSQISDPDLAWYRIYRSTSATPVSYHDVAASETTYRDAAVTVNATYYYWVTGLDSLGSEGPYSDMSTIHVLGGVGVPDSPIWLRPTFTVAPNPFIASARFQVNAPRSSSAAVEIFDVNGKLVAAPELHPIAAGVWETTWTGEDSQGKRVCPGIYVVKCTSASASETHKVIVLR